MVVRSPKSFMKKIRAELLQKRCKVSHMTVFCHLSKEFKLKFYKRAKIPKLTPAIKAKRLAFVLKHRHWTTMQWGRQSIIHRQVYPSTVCSTQVPVRRPPVRYDDRYTISTIKHPPCQMIWRAISKNRVGGLYFLTPETNMNGPKYAELLSDKLKLHIEVHNCNIFMQNGAPGHRPKLQLSFCFETKSKCSNRREIALISTRLKIHERN